MILESASIYIAAETGIISELAILFFNNAKRIFALLEIKQTW